MITRLFYLSMTRNEARAAILPYFSRRGSAINLNLIDLAEDPLSARSPDHLDRDYEETHDAAKRDAIRLMRTRERPENVFDALCLTTNLAKKHRYNLLSLLCDL